MKRQSMINPELMGEAQPGRAAFLDRVRVALGRQKGVRLPGARPVIDERLVRQVAADADREKVVARWVAQAVDNKMQVTRVGADGVAAAVDAALEGYAINSVLLNAARFEKELGLGERFVGRGVKVTRWGEADCAELAYAADASVTECRYGLADTGALLVWSDAGFGRSSTLTVPVHVVILPESQILPDLVDGLGRVLGDCGGRMPSNIVVINGPSKTADIEMNLVTGVHGPKFVHVVVVAE